VEKDVGDARGMECVKSILLTLNCIQQRLYLSLTYQVDGHGAEMGPELDEEMEKVFAMDAGEKFDVARFGSPSESAGSDRDRDRGPLSRYGDRDFNRKYYLFFSCRLVIFSNQKQRRKNCII